VSDLNKIQCVLEKSTSSHHMAEHSKSYLLYG